MELNTGNTIQPNTSCGAPQGSLLGPFLLYINGIYNSSEKLSFYLFARFTDLLYADKSLRSHENNVDAELSNVSTWLMANKLSLNVSKSILLYFVLKGKTKITMLI